MKYPVATFVSSLYDRQRGTFRFTQKNQTSNLYSTAFGVFSLDLLGMTDSIDKSLTQDYILSLRSEKGYYIDPTLIPDNNSKHDENYILLQSTLFAILILKCLDYSEPTELPFLQKYKDENFINKWFYSLNWKNPWLISNEIMFIFMLMELEDVDNSRYQTYILELLDREQDTKNGMWNLNNFVSLHNQMAGAYHFVFLYEYKDRNIQYYNKIVSHTLKIQNYDGLFNYSTGGGSCDDLDAIDILARTKIYAPDLTDKVLPSLHKAYNGLIKNQNSDGGFCWAKRDRNVIRLLLHSISFSLLPHRDFLQNIVSKLKRSISLILKKEKKTWRFSNLKAMEANLEESDIFSTWFRLLGLHIMCYYYPEEFQAKELKKSASKNIEFSYFR